MTKLIRQFFFAILLGSLIASCAHTKHLKEHGYYNEKYGESAHLKVLQLTEKNTKVDMVIQVENRYPFTIIIPENSVHFDINGERAIGASNPHWILRPGDVVRTEEFTLKYQNSGHGPSNLSIDYIYKGEDAVASGSNSTVNSQTNGIAAGGRGIAIAHSSSTGNVSSQGYVTKSSIEGKQLPPISIAIPD